MEPAARLPAGISSVLRASVLGVRSLVTLAQALYFTMRDSVIQKYYAHILAAPL